MLLVALGLPVLIMVIQGFFRNAFDPQTQAKICDGKFKTAVLRMRQDWQPSKDPWRAVDACMAKMVTTRGGDDLTTMVRVAVAHERGRKIDKSVLAGLAHSNFDRHRAFAEAYLRDKLSPAEAGALVKRMPKTVFVYSMAKVHALETARLTHVRDKVLGPPGSPLPSVLAGLAMFAASGLGLLLWAAYGAVRASGFLRPLGHPMGDLAPAGGDRCALQAALYLVLYVAAGFLVAVGLTAFVPNAYRNVSEPLMLVIQSSVMAIGYVVISRMNIAGRRITFADIGIGASKFWTHAVWGIGGYFANLPVLIGLGLISARLFSGIPQVEHPAVLSAQGATSAVTVLLLLLGASVFAPFLEEIWFRGTLLPAFTAATGKPVWGIVITSLLFSALHPTGVHSLLPLASVGAMGAMLTYQTKSLVPAMLMHAFHNAVALAMTIAVYHGVVIG